MSAPVWILAPDPSNQCCDCSARAGPCDSCSCLFDMPTLLIDGTQVPYANQAAAQAAIDNGTQDCLCEVFYPSDGTTVAIQVSAPTGGLEILDHKVENGNGNLNRLSLFRLALAAGPMGIVYHLEASQVITELFVGAVLYMDDQITQVSTDGDDQFGVNLIDGTLNLTVPADGYYYLVFGWGALGPVGSGFDVTLNPCTTTPVSAVCSPRAAYTSGSDTLYVTCTTI